MLSRSGRIFTCMRFHAASAFASERPPLDAVLYSFTAAMNARPSLEGRAVSGGAVLPDGETPVPATATVTEPAMSLRRLRDADTACNDWEALAIGLQRQVLKGVVEGKSNREIARALNIAEGTVKLHLAGLFKVLGATNRAHAAALGKHLID